MSQSKLTKRHIGRFWKKMARLYGHKWVSQYGVSDDGTWLTVLSIITLEQFAFGITKLIAEGTPDDWPPTAMNFRDYFCRAIISKQTAVDRALNGAKDELSVKIRQRIGSFNIQTLCGGAWSFRELEYRLGAAYDAVLDDQEQPLLEKRSGGKTAKQLMNDLEGVLAKP